jgi:CRISPR-associated endonuclease Cas1
MAAGHTLAQPSGSRKSPITKAGVLTISGFGVRVKTQNGHLHIEDGVGLERRTVKLPRVNHGLKRLICVSEDGFTTFSALKWLSDTGASFVMLNRSGKVLFATGPVGSSDARLRRAQALAMGNPVGLELCRALIDAKLEGEERVMRELLNDLPTANVIAGYRERLQEAGSIDAVRGLEASAASSYFARWREIPVLWPTADLRRIPAHWRTAGTRQSPLSGGPRLAVTPVHAILNYCFALLEAESRLALAALGLDPGLGVGLHTDTANRDSLALDVLEPVRPEVEKWVLHWIARERLRRADFFETETGNCRIRSQLCAHLAQTATFWGTLVAPWAEWVAETLWSSSHKPASTDRRLPTNLTQRHRSEGRGNEFVLHLNVPSHPSNICSSCGGVTKRGRHCPKCGRQISREKLVELAKQGRVAALSSGAQAKRSETQRRHEAAKRVWRTTTQISWPDNKLYLEQIWPRLANASISTLASTLGVCESYAADIRKGRHIPHPRHWALLAQLVRIDLENSFSSESHPAAREQ